LLAQFGELAGVRCGFLGVPLLGVLHTGRGKWDGEWAGGMEIIKGLVLLRRGTGM